MKSLQWVKQASALSISFMMILQTQTAHASISVEQASSMTTTDVQGILNQDINEMKSTAKELAELTALMHVLQPKWTAGNVASAAIGGSIVGGVIAHYISNQAMRVADKIENKYSMFEFAESHYTKADEELAERAMRLAEKSGMGSLLAVIAAVGSGMAYIAYKSVASASQSDELNQAVSTFHDLSPEAQESKLKGDKQQVVELQAKEVELEKEIRVLQAVISTR